MSIDLSALKGMTQEEKLSAIQAALAAIGDTTVKVKGSAAKESVRLTTYERAVKTLTAKSNTLHKQGVSLLDLGATLDEFRVCLPTHITEYQYRLAMAVIDPSYLAWLKRTAAGKAPKGTTISAEAKNSATTILDCVNDAIGWWNTAIDHHDNRHNCMAEFLECVTGHGSVEVTETEEDTTTEEANA